MMDMCASATIKCGFFSIGTAQGSVIFSGTILKIKQLTDVPVQPTLQVLVCTDFQANVNKITRKVWKPLKKCSQIYTKH